MELFVCTAPRGLSPLPRRPTPAAVRPPSSVFLLLRRQRPTRALRCTNADWPEPAEPEDDAASGGGGAAVVVTEKPEEAVAPPASEEKPQVDTGVASSGTGDAVEEVAAPSAASEEQGWEADGDGGGDLLSQALGSKLDFEETPTYVLYGGGAFLAGWILSAIVSAIDSIPLFPKVLEIVGLGYTIWFSSRYLLFKKNRDELFAKIDELKQQILGSGDE